MIKRLKDLQIGDKFYPASKVEKATPIFEVIGESIGTVRLCKNLQKDRNEYRASYLKVVLTTKSNKLN